MNLSKLKKGFTLIEIVIVLAIAALIMVVVFFAVQGAQRSQRNQTRKDVANRVKAAMVSARGNNNGAAPAAGQLATNYVPTGERALAGTTIGMTDPGTSLGAVGATCTTSDAAVGVEVLWGSPDTAQICLETAAGAAAGVVYIAQ